MVLPYSFSPWANLSFFVAEALLLTACSWHTSRWYIWPELHLVTQKWKGFIYFIVMSQPAWATCSWHQCSTKSAILLDFGNNTGCCFSFASADLWILPPTLNIPSPSMNESNFTMLLHDLKHFPFAKEINSSPKCLLWTDLIISFSAILISSKFNGALNAALSDPIL